MDIYKKSRRWARLCFLTSAIKIAFCVAGVMFSGTTLPPDTSNFNWFNHIGVGYAKIGFLVFVGGLTLIPFYRKVMLPQPERVDARRYMALAFGLDGLVDIIRITWPHEWHSHLAWFNFPFTIFLVIAMHYDLSDPNNRPRKKRKFKAKWPAWIKKRWSPTPRHHQPTPQPNPQPRPSN